jgi:hypothetical protein
MGTKTTTELSVLLVPTKPTAVQVARDMTILGKALMMSYDLDADADAPFLHIWDGEGWRPVPADLFASGGFLKGNASRVVVVGEETDQTAFLIEQALAWCPEVLHMRTTDVTELINRLGKVYGLSNGQWRWIAERYELELENLNRGLPRSNWYRTHSPRDVPETDPPWKRRKPQEMPEPPATSLSPIEETE